MVAEVIIDISHKNLDHTFSYRIPERLEADVQVGSKVEIPFGKGDKIRTGYVVEVGEEAKKENASYTLKEIAGIVPKSVSAEENLVALADFIHRRYGSTMINALKTVLPVKKASNKKVRQMIVSDVPEITIKQGIQIAEGKKQRAKVRLLEELLRSNRLSYSLVTGKLNVSSSTIKSLEKDGFLSIEVMQSSDTPFAFRKEEDAIPTLSDEQRTVVESIEADRKIHPFGEYYIYGITGSGKTEVYMRLIENCLSEGKQAILLIPEIALTYQNLMRFYRRFGNKVAVVHSKLTDSEKFEQFEKAKNGEISIMIGPRSALFTPFPNLGMVIIDEEHESSYKSETMPKYHAREVAAELCRLTSSSLVMGSATPSLESFSRIQKGEIKCFKLNKRLTGGELPSVHIVDMKEELQSGNRTVFSAKLATLMQDRLEKGEQTMLFLNRRGYAGSMLCRDCGEVIKCPHCDISLSEHRGGVLMCHYCGYMTDMVKKCPKCGSTKVAGFRAGTEQIEEEIKKRFPQAVVLRMDADTTKKAEDYEAILSRFASREADILLGTQMIVKGHDFPGVTLMGILLADTSLSHNDYRAAERTFQLLTQAAGRAGRASSGGETVIQTYQPEHYAIVHAANQDYEGFYKEEIEYRDFMEYPPCGHMLCVQFFGPDWNRLSRLSLGLTKEVSELFTEDAPKQIGPGKAALGKKNDIYRQVVYYKHHSAEPLTKIKDFMEERIQTLSLNKEQLQFDFDPMNTF